VVSFRVIFLQALILGQESVTIEPLVNSEKVLFFHLKLGLMKRFVKDFIEIAWVSLH
jgi:hypothetical protein